MSKQSGLGDALYVAGYDLSGDTQSLGTIAGGPSPIDKTGINKSAHERIGGKIDGVVELTSHFNPAASQEHAVWSALPTTDVVACYLRGTTLGNPAAGIVAKQANYDPSRGADGDLLMNVRLLANGYGLEWGSNLTAGIATETGAASGSAVDYLSDKDLGLRAYLHVFAFTGTDATIAVQDSANGTTSWANVAAFTQVTSGPTTERIATGATENVKRFLRYNVTTTGGFSNLQFAVVAIQNEVAVTL